MKVFEEERANLKVELAGVHLIYLTADCWTSRRTKQYMSITAHYVSEDWKLQKKILNVRHFPPPHTGQAMANLMTEFLTDQNVESKVFTITLDNASANNSMIKILREFRARWNLAFEFNISREVFSSCPQFSGAGWSRIYSKPESQDTGDS